LSVGAAVRPTRRADDGDGPGSGLRSRPTVGPCSRRPPAATTEDRWGTSLVRRWSCSCRC